MIDQMQQIMYEDAPLLVLTYPQSLQAYNAEKWTGWTPLVLGGKPGPVFASDCNLETYLSLKPAAQSGKSSNTPWISAIVAGAVVAVAVVVWIVVRRRNRPGEEADEA